MCMKIIRHGFDSHNPNGPERRPNYILLEEEIEDLLVAIELLSNNFDILLKNCDLSEVKRRKLKYTHFQKGNKNV